MKLDKILDKLNSLEKNAFLKIIDTIISSNPANLKEIEKILTEKEKGLRNADNLNIARVFALIENEFTNHLQNEFINITSQLDILVDILIRDGNSILSREWFNKLYDKELHALKNSLKEFQTIDDGKKSEIDPARLRDYKIYTECIKTAYLNDRSNNQENKITRDEQSILITLSQSLELSQEEIKLINYSILPLDKADIEDIINYLRNLGILFYSKKNHYIYIPDEIVCVLRRLRGKDVADKYLRRVLKVLKDPFINNICRKHNISLKLSREEKIAKIIKEGISFTSILSNDIFKENTNVTEKKNFLNDLIITGLNIQTSIKGTTLEDKVSNLIQYFDNLEKDDKIGMTLDGYNKLLVDLGTFKPALNSILKEVFKLEEENVLQGDFLIELGIKPADIIDLLSSDDLENFCKLQKIKIRGNSITNIIEAYKDTENILLDNYVNIGFRNYNALKDNGLNIKEVEIGLKFEDLTRLILSKLGFNVDEKLRKKLNTAKDQVDIIINLGNGDIIIVECKTIKESGYNKFSSVSRQIKSYFSLVNGQGLKVVKSLLIAPEFSDDFISECELEYELNLSLITASSLLNILKGLQKSRHNVLPYNLLMRDVLIKEDRILKAIEK
ncbi:MAG: hypothetical protein KA096_00925 [Bacteroidales bacterium]|nr:hypothetical protein [Bacteroidales bacterium]